MHLVKEFGRIAYFFQEPRYDTEESLSMREKVWTADSARWMSVAAAKLESISDDNFTLESITSKLSELCQEENVKMGKIYPSFRYALTASFVGAGVPETILTLGRLHSIQRIQNAATHQPSL